LLKGDVLTARVYVQCSLPSTICRRRNEANGMDMSKGEPYGQSRTGPRASCFNAGRRRTIFVPPGAWEGSQVQAPSGRAAPGSRSSAVTRAGRARGTVPFSGHLRCPARLSISSRGCAPPALLDLVRLLRQADLISWFKCFTKRAILFRALLNACTKTYATL
jgi:hypothetical protein